MIYLISQFTFIFLTQIYYNMNFITLPLNSITRFLPGTLRSIFANCFWRTKIWKISCSLKTLLKIQVFKNFFPNFSGNCILINFQTKTRKCVICWLLWIQNYQITGNYLTSNTTFPKKVTPMKYRIQTFILVRTWNLLFMLILLLVYPIRPWNLLDVKKHLTWLKVISSYNIYSGINGQQSKKLFLIQYQKLLIFLEFLCFISSNYFRAFNFMCAFNW